MYCFVTPTEYLPFTNLYGIKINQEIGEETGFDFEKRKPTHEVYFSITVFYKNIDQHDMKFRYTKKFESIVEAQQFILKIYGN